MTFRKIIFWCHLTCGVTAGIVVLMMSVTGVLLTYERQMLAWADSNYYSRPAAGAQRKPLDAMINTLQMQEPEAWPVLLTVYADPEAPVSAAMERGRILYFSPYTGELLGEGAKGIREFFGLMLQWHRWFNVSGDGRDTARAITGASNLMFLFLVLSGMYLWLPRTWKWIMFRAHLFFNRENPTSKARDFNWHHVFGIWSAVPLAVVVATATVFSYPWASNLVYRAFGEEPPSRGGPAQMNPAAGASRITSMMHPSASGILPVEDLFQKAAMQIDGWNMITVRFPKDLADPLVFSIDRGDGGQPHKQATLSLNTHTGDVVKFETFSDLTPGRQARSLVRRLHTGEALGIAGQTVAGLVSFAGVILVWTGLALAYRRLIQPLWSRRRQTSA